MLGLKPLSNVPVSFRSDGDNVLDNTAVHRDL